MKEALLKSNRAKQQYAHNKFHVCILKYLATKNQDKIYIKALKSIQLLFDMKQQISIHNYRTF